MHTSVIANIKFVGKSLEVSEISCTFATEK